MTPPPPSSDPAAEEARLRERLLAKAAAQRRSHSRERRSTSIEQGRRPDPRNDDPRHYDPRRSPPRNHRYDRQPSDPGRRRAAEYPPPTHHAWHRQYPHHLASLPPATGTGTAATTAEIGASRHGYQQDRWYPREFDEYDRQHHHPQRHYRQQQHRQHHHHHHHHHREDSRTYPRRRSSSPPSPRRSRRSRSLSESSRSSNETYSSKSSSSSSSSSPSETTVEPRTEQEINESSLTRDQRTVFVSQLVMRATEKDIAKYFDKKKGIPIVDIQMIRDRGSTQHKGQAYVELRHVQDVPKAVQLCDQIPHFQRFPLLIKASQAEKNYQASQVSSTVTAAQMGVTLPAPQNNTSPEGQWQESQKVYVGNLETTVKAEHLFTAFLPFGSLERVVLQVETATGVSKGFAFLSYRNAKEANLAIQTMSNQNLMGKPLKTGWATQVPVSASQQLIRSDEFPPDASSRAQKAYQVLTQLTMGVPATQILSQMQGSSANTSKITETRGETGAEARVTVTTVEPTVLLPSSTQTTSVQDDPTQIGRSERPSTHILVRNMFDKDKETEEGWWKDIEAEFRHECGKFGLTHVRVMHLDVGGKIYASFDSGQGAEDCAKTLAGRWFDQRQLRVDYVDEQDTRGEYSR